MQVAINYSLEAATLVHEERIHIDRFKTPDWPDMIEEASVYRPVAVHFNLFAGRGDLVSSDWDIIRSLKKQTGTPYINLHLNPEVVDYPDVPLDITRGPQFNEIVHNLIQDVQAAVDVFGAEQVIVENVPFRGWRGDTLRLAVDPHIIRKVVEETGCGLLLDLSHARISACFLGVDDREYISALPVDRLRELHFNGLNWVNGNLKHHLPALRYDWQALSWALKHIRSGEWAPPWLLAFEYGGVGDKYKERSEPTVISEQIPRIFEMISD